jgi:hypothetical protein
MNTDKRGQIQAQANHGIGSGGATLWLLQNKIENPTFKVLFCLHFKYAG